MSFLKKSPYYLLLFLTLNGLFFGCKEEPYNPDPKLQRALIHDSLDALTDVIVHDIFSPPVASRIYAYANIASYEILAQGDDQFQSLAGKLKDLNPIPKPTDDLSAVDNHLAAVLAFNQTGRTLIFSEDSLNQQIDHVLKTLTEAGLSKKAIKHSQQYADIVTKHILNWADGDNYKATRSYPKHSVDQQNEAWKPTPPMYMEGIEPHWREMRPLVIKSADQFTPPPPTPYDMTKGSKFYKEAVEVMDAVNDLTDETEEIARFWDCNPYVANVAGHAMFATKKITPGGHWMGIANIVSEKANLSPVASAYLHTITAIALYDGFISCWDEKYRSNLVRPETVINEALDPDWVPLLQTPPFPEYTSGHSVISNSAATVLTQMLGNEFSFDDDVEVKYGLPVRSFKSFLDAADEAAISRLYGGIHYMPAIEYGVTQGREVGGYINDILSVKKL